MSFASATDAALALRSIVDRHRYDVSTPRQVDEDYITINAPVPSSLVKGMYMKLCWIFIHEWRGKTADQLKVEMLKKVDIEDKEYIKFKKNWQ